MKAYSPELIAEIRRLYSEEKLGMTTIARQTGLGKTSVSYYLRDLVPTRPNRLYATRAEALAAKLKDTCACGRPMRVGAKRCGACVDLQRLSATQKAKSSPLPKKPVAKPAPVVQGQNSGLVNRRPGVRVLPGVSDGAVIAQLRQEAHAPLQKEPTCRHHWLLESSSGPTIRAVCKLCGKTRDFPVV